jgi:hypothetical protein
MELLEAGETRKQALRRAREHCLDHSTSTRSRSACGCVWLYGMRRHPRSDPEEIVLRTGGVDFAAREHFLEDGAEERREGDPASQTTVEEVGDDRIFGEGACEQATRSTRLQDA